jgi:hypothetical protein
VFAEVCFFPRLQQFIINQDWNDPKSKLQQCCLTLRAMNGKDPDIPVYKASRFINRNKVKLVCKLNRFTSPKLQK